MNDIMRRMLPACVILGVTWLVMLVARDPLLPPAHSTRTPDGGGRPATASARIDAIVEGLWQKEGIEPASRVDDLLVLRRAWLASAGTIPSLEEIRRFERDDRPDRLERWLDDILADRRTADHLARVLSHVLVGDDQGPFVVFRRDRFLAWLADAIHAREPFDEIVRRMVASEGLWTGEPAVNFITQAVSSDTVDPVKLAGRVSRAMLGQRIDCAECHDHPFAPVTQAQFEGLAACFAQVKVSPLGVQDDPSRVFTIEVPASMQPMESEDGQAFPMAAATARRVPPAPPFAPEWMPDSGTRRHRLAEWVVHPANRRFERAIANRAWQVVFCKPWHAPVDDLPNPPQGGAEGGRDPSDLLDVLGEAFRAGECDLLALLRTLFDTRLFRIASAHVALDEQDTCDGVQGAWAAFPLSRLPADSIMGAMQQCTQLETIDGDSHLITRTVRFLRQIDFVREYGEPSDGAAIGDPVTIPQALVRMNGRLVREMVEANPFTASGRIARMAPDDDSRIEAAFLCCLTRRPTQAEQDAIVPLLRENAVAGSGMEDVFWSLFNSAEFFWNH
ncbi:MAG: DUF1549 domain-containing protein [Planctomycetaceae bacterium]